MATGQISSAIAALDWAVQQKVNNWWNIRVINMSFGTGAKDSYINDPLCQAARRAVNAGIVVVASAGNNGKDAYGQKILRRYQLTGHRAFGHHGRCRKYFRN